MAESLAADSTVHNLDPSGKVNNAGPARAPAWAGPLNPVSHGPGKSSGILLFSNTMLIDYFI